MGGILRSESDTRGGILRRAWGHGQQAFGDIVPGAVFFPFRASGNGDGGEHAEEEEEEEEEGGRRDASSGG